MTQALDVRPVAGSLGAEVHGLNLADALEPETFDAIHQALLDHLVLFFPEQSLTAEQHVAFGRLFGPLDTKHPPYLPVLEGHPEVVVLSGQEGGKADLWHTDVTISPTPPAGSILHMQTAPAYGGDTMWANMYRMGSRRLAAT